MSNQKKAVVNVSLASAKAEVGRFLKASEIASKAISMAEKVILEVLGTLLNGNPGAKEALDALGYESSQEKVRFLRDYCRYESDLMKHNERLRDLAFITAFGQLQSLDTKQEAAMIAAMTRGEGRKVLERFIVEGLRPLNNAVAEFYRAKEEAEIAKRALAKAKAREKDEYRKIGVRR